MKDTKDSELLHFSSLNFVLLCFIIFAPRAKFCRSRRLSDRIFSRQVAKTLSDGSNAIIPTHGEVSEGEIKNVLLRAFASLREIFRFFRLRLCCAGIFATFVVNVLFLFWLRLRRARLSVVKSLHGKIAVTTSSRLRCTCGSSVMPQVTATWQARRGAMPSLISRPA